MRRLVAFPVRSSVVSRKLFSWIPPKSWIPWQMRHPENRFFRKIVSHWSPREGNSWVSRAMNVKDTSSFSTWDRGKLRYSRRSSHEQVDEDGFPVIDVEAFLAFQERADIPFFWNTISESFTDRLGSVSVITHLRAELFWGTRASNANGFSQLGQRYERTNFGLPESINASYFKNSYWKTSWWMGIFQRWSTQIQRVIVFWLNISD